MPIIEYPLYCKKCPKILVDRNRQFYCSNDCFKKLLDLNQHLSPTDFTDFTKEEMYHEAKEKFLVPALKNLAEAKEKDAVAAKEYDEAWGTAKKTHFANTDNHALVNETAEYRQIVQLAELEEETAREEATETANNAEKAAEEWKMAQDNLEKAQADLDNVTTSMLKLTAPYAVYEDGAVTEAKGKIDITQQNYKVWGARVREIYDMIQINSPNLNDQINYYWSTLL